WPRDASQGRIAPSCRLAPTRPGRPAPTRDRSAPRSILPGATGAGDSLARGSSPRQTARPGVMRRLQGLSPAEISQRSDRTPAAVAGLLKRDLAELRTLLPDERE